MNIPEAERLARELMDEHGLIDWTFKFDNAKKRFGSCSHSKRAITLSFYLVAMNEKSEVVEIIKHEIAHALVGPDQGHNGIWKRQARAIGANPSRTYDSEVVKSPEGRWIAHCLVHGNLGRPRHRRSKNRVCKRCRSPIEWRER